MKKLSLVFLLALLLTSLVCAEKNTKVIATIPVVGGGDNVTEIVVKASADLYIELELGDRVHILLKDSDARDIVEVIERYDMVVAEVQGGNTSEIYARFTKYPVIPARPYETKLNFVVSCQGSVEKTTFGIEVLVNAGDGGGYCKTLLPIYLTQSQAHDLSTALKQALDAKSDYYLKVTKMMRIIRGND